MKHTEETKRKISEALVGKKHTEETKKKMSLAKMGNTHASGNKNMLGRTHSEETRKKLSVAHSGKERLYRRGNKCNFWRGGITPINLIIRTSLKYKNWRTKVFERDNYTCQRCKQKGGRLHAHHIQSFSEYPTLRFDINNGITLCMGCHKLVGDCLKNLSTEEKIKLLIVPIMEKCPNFMGASGILKKLKGSD